MNFKQSLYHPKTNKVSILSNLKEQGFNGFIKQIKQNKNNPYIRLIVEGNLFPQNINKIHVSNSVYYSDNFGGELAWLTWSFYKHADKLNHFITLKKSFENNLVKNDLDKGLKILAKIDEQISYSFWGIENRFSVLETFKGTEGNWKYLNTLTKELKKSKDANLIGFYFNYLSKKAETDISYTRYKRSMNYDLGNLDSGWREFLMFRLGHFIYPEYENYSQFLLRSTANSLIDRYELVITLIQHLVSKENFENLDDVKSCLLLISSKIKDDRIKRILEYLEVLKFEDSSSSDVHKYMEAYSRGKYKYCIDEFEKTLENNPDAIEIIEPFIKSTYELSIPLKMKVDDSEIGKAIICLYHIYNNSLENTYDIEELLKIIIKYPTLSFSLKLLSLVSGMTRINGSKIINNLYFFNSNYSNPVGYLINPAIHFNFENSLSHSINYKISQNTYELEDLKDLIPQKKRHLYHIRSLFGRNDIVKLKEEICKFQDSYKLIGAEESELFVYEFYTLLRNKSYAEAVKLYVDSSHSEKLHSTIVDVELVYQQITEEEVLVNEIEMVIFYHQANATSYYQFVALEDFCNSISIDKPRGLLDYINVLEKWKVIYLLKNICTEDVMGNFLEFEDRNQVTEERKFILTKLLDYDVDNKEAIISELARINSQRKIKSLMKEVNDGRITINSSSLDLTHRTVLQNSFSRLKLLIEFTKDNDFLIYDDEGEISVIYENEVKTKTSNASFVAFKALFNELTNNFLYSKEYGLDGCLSTRIRHGALENVIRGTIERFNLVSKINDGTYQDIEFWTIQYNIFTRDEILRLQNCLKIFSKKIDEIIIDLIENKIQIYTSKNQQSPQGFFNYQFNEDFYMYVYETLKSADTNYDEFVDAVFDILKTRTVSICDKIRQLHFPLVLENVLSEFNSLSDSINKEFQDKKLVSLENSIMSAKTQFINEMENNVFKWFKLTEDYYESLLDFSSVIQTSLSLVQFKNIGFKPKIICDEDFSTYGYIHFIYIFQILLENVIEHSHLEYEKQKCSIELSHSESTLNIKVANNVCETLDKKHLIHTLDSIKKDWITSDTDGSKVNIEGGSGLAKIKRILKYDLGAKLSKFDYEYENNRITIELLIPMKIYE
ncbi:hypothetical protein [Nonlabens xiamenensis]|uniref:hypothetical protein n=1 Tax=Nonlabens xiamenensis TaxID=2341043 RepID=UPI000F60AA43|nr:hypothetical protein [Nonlabens xiamenensis]